MDEAAASTDAAPGGRNERVEALWDELSRPLRAHFRRHARTPEDAEDLLQEVFLRVHTGIDQVEDTERLGGWIRRVGQRLLIDSWRAAGRPAEDARATQDAADLAAEPQEEDLDRLVAGWLEGMIEELDEPDREALRLAELERVPQTQIAARLGLSPSGAKSRVQRARARLRERLLACCAVEFDRRGGGRRLAAPGRGLPGLLSSAKTA